MKKRRQAIKSLRERETGQLSVASGEVNEVAVLPGKKRKSEEDVNVLEVETTVEAFIGSLVASASPSVEKRYGGAPVLMT